MIWIIFSRFLYWACLCEKKLVIDGWLKSSVICLNVFSMYRSRIVCERMSKRWSFVGLEPHIFCYPGRCIKPVRLEQISNPRLVSEYIITDASNVCFTKRIWIVFNRTDTFYLLWPSFLIRERTGRDLSTPDFPP
jgi:hypothetical protein